MAQITINVNDQKMNLESWNGFITMYPLPEENPPDVSTAQKKLDYIASIMKKYLAHVVRRGIELNQKSQINVDVDITE